MIVGVPKEIKIREYRVGMVPGAVKSLVDGGHRVLVEAGAGVGSGIPDTDYARAGAEMVASADEVWKRAEMVVKVKEPIAPEYARMQEGQIVYTYFHLAGVDPELTRVLLKKKVSAVAYETIQLDDGSLPLLRPMSEVAGKMSIQVGAASLEKEHGGKGILLGGVPGVRRGPGGDHRRRRGGHLRRQGGGGHGRRGDHPRRQPVAAGVPGRRLPRAGSTVLSSDSETIATRRCGRPTWWSAACSSPAARPPSSSPRR